MDKSRSMVFIKEQNDSSMKDSPDYESAKRKRCFTDTIRHHCSADPCIPSVRDLNTRKSPRVSDGVLDRYSWLDNLLPALPPCGLKTPIDTSSCMEMAPPHGQWMPGLLFPDYSGEKASSGSSSPRSTAAMSSDFIAKVLPPSLAATPIEGGEGTETDGREQILPKAIPSQPNGESLLVCEKSNASGVGFARGNTEHADDTWGWFVEDEPTV